VFRRLLHAVTMMIRSASVLSIYGLVVLSLSACSLVQDTAKLHDTAPGPGVPLPVPRPHFVHIRPAHRVVVSMPLLRGTMAPIESQRSPSASRRKAVPKPPTSIDPASATGSLHVGKPTPALPAGNLAVQPLRSTGWGMPILGSVPTRSETWEPAR